MAVEAARRHGRRDGFDLVSFREVGLPIYRLNTTAIVTADQPLPEMQAFVLRTVDAGLDAIEDITGFLGLEPGDLDDVLFSLAAEGLLRVTSEPGRPSERLVLSEKGVRATETLRTAQTLERTFLVDYDGLLRTPVPRRREAIRPRALREQGAIEIAPSPPKKPSVEALDLGVVESVLRQTRDLPRSHLLLELVCVNRADTLFVPAVILVFRARVGDEVQVGFVVDGRLSEDHELAFAASQGPERLGLLARDGALFEAAREVLGDVGRQALAIARAESEAAETAEPVGGMEGDSEVAEALPAYQLVETYEHPVLLERSLDETRQRLIIVSPWIKRRVVDEAFAGRLRALLRRGVQVYIGYGLGETGPQDDEDAVHRLARLAHEFENFTFERFGDTHAKVLVSDESFAIVGSFNWLSFVGDPRKTFRDERGMLVRDPAAVREVIDSVLARFRAPAV
jgi:phosphatidylserine/phosphatidylglycerophosphate/cardiolipin synthase-like enzyme